MIHYINPSPGQLWVTVKARDHDGASRNRLVQRLLAQPGVKLVRPSEPFDRVFIGYDPDRVRLDALLLLLESSPARPGAASGDGAGAVAAMEPHGGLGAALANALLDKAFKHFDQLASASMPDRAANDSACDG